MLKRMIQSNTPLDAIVFHTSFGDIEISSNRECAKKAMNRIIELLNLCKKTNKLIRLSDYFEDFVHYNSRDIVLKCDTILGIDFPNCYDLCMKEVL